MAAFNAAGTGKLTTAWSPVAPLVGQAPGVPAVTGVTARSGKAIVSWAAPVDTGGLPVASYQVTATPAEAPAGTTPTTTLQAAPDARSLTVTGLVNGTSYTMNVVAVSSIGPSAAGSITVTPRPTHAPTAPTGLTATPGDGSAAAPTGSIAVSWTAPADNGGVAVSGYTLTWRRAAYKTSSGTWQAASGAPLHSQTVAPSTDPSNAAGAVAFTVPPAGFEQPTAAYLFAVTATNTAGTSVKATTPAGVSPTVSTKVGTVVLTPATLDALTSVGPTTLSWRNPAPAQIKTLQPGQVVVGNTISTAAPSGFLRTVTAIAGQHNTSGNTTVTTTDAALPDAFTNASATTTVNPLADSSAGTATPNSSPAPANPTTTPTRPRFVPAMPGVTVSDDQPVGGNPVSNAPGSPSGSIGGAVSITASITVNIEVNTGPVKIEGALTVTPTIGFELNLTTGAFGLPNGVRMSQSAKVAAQTQFTTTINGEKKIKIGEIPSPPIPIGPVVIQPRIPIYLVIAGSASVTTIMGMTVGAQLGWDSARPAALFGRNLSSAPTIGGAPEPGSATVSGSVGLAVEPAMTIYGVAGPFIAAQLDLKAEYKPFPQAGQSYFTLTPQLSFKLGLKLDLFGTEADVSLTLATITFGAYTIGTAPTASYTISPPAPSVAPGRTLQLIATRTDGESSAQTWTLLGGTNKDRITNTGLFTAGGTSGRTLAASVRDTTGATGRVVITIGDLFDPPGSPTAIAARDQSGAPITIVNWTAPRNTAGSAVQTYTVITAPDTGLRTVSAATTSLTIPGVSAGTYISIYAQNAKGQVSPAATTSSTSSPRLFAAERVDVQNPGETFAVADVTVNSQDISQVVLSGSANGLDQLFVDDVLVVEVTHEDGSTATLTDDFSGGCVTITPSGPIDLSPYLAEGTNHLHFSLQDACGTSEGNSDIYLVT